LFGIGRKNAPVPAPMPLPPVGMKLVNIASL